MNVALWFEGTPPELCCNFSFTLWRCSTAELYTFFTQAPGSLLKEPEFLPVIVVYGQNTNLFTDVNLIK